MEMSQVTLEIFSKLEHKWLSHSNKTRILCIDGGGTTAIVAAASLLHLERQIRLKTADPHAQIADFFDIIAGTGIGALLASLITADDGSGHPLLSAKDAAEFISRYNSKLFKLEATGVFRRRRRFSARSMDKVLKEVFKREDGHLLTLKDTCKPLLVPCFNLNSSAPFVFSRADASECPSFNFELWKVCRATTATPGQFKPFALASVDRKTTCSAIDGGLVMNSPTAAAVTHVLHNKRDFPLVSSVEDLLVLSLGNGQSCARARSKFRYNGECSTSTVVDIALDGVSETVDQMVGNAFSWNRTDYVRIQTNGLGPLGSESMVVVGVEEEVLKERGAETLPFGGKRLLTETNGERIEKFVERLVACGRSSSSSLPPSPCKEAAVSPLATGR